MWQGVGVSCPRISSAIGGTPPLFRSDSRSGGGPIGRARQEPGSSGIVGFERTTFVERQIARLDQGWWRRSPDLDASEAVRRGVRLIEAEYDSATQAWYRFDGVSALTRGASSAAIQVPPFRLTGRFCGEIDWARSPAWACLPIRVRMSGEGGPGIIGG